MYEKRVRVFRSSENENTEKSGKHAAFAEKIMVGWWQERDYVYIKMKKHAS